MEAAIEAPQRLAQLPRPIDQVGGRTLAAAVYSLNGSRKRKRSEVVVSADGESLNIYDLQNPRLVASYAVPPQTYFSTTPCSLYRKRRKQSPAERVTYAAVADAATGQNARVTCFSEKISPTETTLNPLAGTEQFTRALHNKTSRVRDIQILGTDSDSDAAQAQHELIVIHEDGEAECLRGDLSGSVWLTDLNDTANGSTASDSSVLFCAYMEEAIARKSLFKDREDVVVQLASAGGLAPQGPGSVIILSVVVESGKNRILRHYSVRPSTGLRSLKKPIDMLVSEKLPDIDHQESSAQSCFALNASGGTLQELRGSTLVTYDISGIKPTVRSCLQLGEEMNDMSCLAEQSVVLSSKHNYALYETKYGSIQGTAQTSMPNPSGTTQTPKGSSVVAAAPVVVDFFPKERLVVCVDGNQLVGLQINQDFPRSANLLVRSIGQGVQLRDLARQSKRSKVPEGFDSYLHGATSLSDKKWAKARVELDALVEEGNVPDFEKAFASQVDVRLRRNKKKNAEKGAEETPKSKERPNGIHANSGFTNGEAAHSDPEEVASHNDEAGRLRKWDFKRDEWTRSSYTEEALYALGKIFGWAKPLGADPHSSVSATESSTVSIQFLPPNVLSWLVRKGYFSAKMINMALREAYPKESLSRSVKPIDVIRAVIDVDPAMGVLFTIISETAHLDLPEIVQTIKILLRSFGLNGAQDVDMDATLDFEELEAAAERDIDLALSTLDNGLVIRGRALRQALTKLQTFSASEITQSLRTELTHADLIDLIQILRLELESGGWTSRYAGLRTDNTDSNDPSDRAIVIITDLLNCCVDAMGTGGWLADTNTSTSYVSSKGLGAEDEDVRADLLTALRAETSAALEGIHEAIFTNGILNDFLRYGKAVDETAQREDKQGLKRTKLSKNEDKTKKRKKGNSEKGPSRFIRTVKPASEEKDEHLLPLSYRVEGEKPTHTLNKATGKKEKISMRLRAKKMHEQTGKYTFEQIRF